MQRAPFAALLAVLAALLVTAPVSAADPGQIWFPMQDTGDLDYTDSWGDTRGGGRGHTGVDIMAPHMNEIYAAWDGEIFSYEGDCAPGEYCSSYYLLLNGDDGRSYFYVHLNNDTPGRPNGCDGLGGIDAAFSPRLAEHLRANGTLEGLRVERGEHIAYNGSSGNAGCVGPHLHFEVWNGHGWGAPKTNPYPIARAAHDAGNVWGPDGALGPMVDHARVAGDSRVSTSVALSAEAFDTAQAVVIAPGGSYPEALVAAPLAAILGGPVLLSWEPAGALITDDVAAEVDRLGAEYAVLVGSEEQLPAEVAEELAAKTGLASNRIRRIAGADRYELSRNVADEILAFHGVGAAEPEPAEEEEPSSDPMPLPPGQTRMSPEAAEEPGPEPVSPLLALGEHDVADRGWPDALSASVLAARDGVPVLLTQPDQLPPDTRAVLETDGLGEVRVIGGPAAIAPEVEEAVHALGLETRRLAGEDRYETSLAVVAELLLDEAVTPDRVLVATGLNFPDALAAGSAVARLGHPMMLVHGGTSEAGRSVYTWLADRAADIGRVDAIGGPVAITEAVLRRLAEAAYADA